jgi:MFS family permease
MAGPGGGRGLTPPMSEQVPLGRARGTILLAGLGYFVDAFDLLLFAVVRVASVRDLGVGDRTLEVGALLQNAQLVGMMVGGLAWGVLGDRRGRRAVLYASIVCYSVATLANATVTTVEAYAVWRVVAGFGLAGELGAALTIVGELVDRRQRGVATALVATLGVLGSVTAALVGELVPWRTAYVIGGVLGFLLLLLRLRVRDSAMFTRTRAAVPARGKAWRLVTSRDRALRFVRAILIGVPIWFAVGILVTFAPELAAALGVTGPVVAGRAVLAFYAATAVGDLLCGLLSQRLGSRRAAVAVFLTGFTAAAAAYLAGVATTPLGVYVLCGALGFGGGFWAVLITMAVEQFGTDLRATVATSVPNFVRVTAVPMTLAFVALKGEVGVRSAAALVGATSIVAAAVALRFQPETFGRDLDFIEAAPTAASPPRTA